jgi:D-sedoheptulose 7-phosphate isomerase
VNDFIDYLSRNVNSLLSIEEVPVQRLVKHLKCIVEQNGTIWLAGNGGSASTASHASCDLSKGVSLKSGRSVRAFSLMDQVATLTAWANDFSYESAVANMCNQTLKSGDCLLVISASGNSPNIVNAVLEAKRLEVSTASLTGFDGGQLSKLSDFNVNIHSNDMQVIENLHLVICHWLFKAL